MIRRRPFCAALACEARAGEVLAMVGSSGAGKTTLVNLLPRFHDVTSGAVRIDGVDVRDATLRSLREQIAIVTQETILFNDTVWNNICYGQANLPRRARRSRRRARPWRTTSSPKCPTATRRFSATAGSA